LLIERSILRGARLSLVLLGTLAVAGCPSARDTGFDGGAGGAGGQPSTGSGGSAGAAGHPAGGAGGQAVTGAGGSAGAAGHATGGAGGIGGQSSTGSGGTGGQQTAGSSGTGGQTGGAGGTATGGQAGSSAGSSGQGGSLPPLTTLDLLAGQPGGAGNVDGVGPAARFGTGMCGLVFDPNSDNVFVADTGNHTIRRISLPSGSVSTLAGSPGVPGGADGKGAAARFKSPCGLTLDPSSNASFFAFYVADTGNHTIRHVDSSGNVTTLAGSAGMPGTTDAAGSAARFRSPAALVAPNNGFLYVADTGNHTIRAIDGSGTVTTISGSAGMAADVDSTMGAMARLHSPNDIVTDSLGNLFIADTGNNAIRQLTLPTGGLSTVASGPALSGVTSIASDGGTIFAVVPGANQTATLEKVIISPPGPVTVSTFMQLATYGVVRFDSAGNNLYMAGWGDNQVDEINNLYFGTAGTSVLAGSGSHFDTGTTPALTYPSSIGTDGSSVLFVNNQINYSMEQISVSTGAITRISANCLGGILGFANVTSTNVTVSCEGGSTIDNVSRSGAMTRLAGAGNMATGSLNGTGTAASFNNPQGLSDNGSGTVYVADTSNNMIRQVVVGSGAQDSGVVTTLAGSSSAPAGNVDATGTAASFNMPTQVAADGKGNLYVVDAGNHTIRKIVIASKVVSTVAGSPGMTGTTNGVGSAARFVGPSGVAADAAGNLYVSDGNTVRQIIFSGTTATVSTFIGVPGQVGLVLGALPAGLNAPAGLVMLSDGSLIITDSNENAVLRAH
jgi:sugar lactone lactonase YvrE